MPALRADRRSLWAATLTLAPLWCTASCGSGKADSVEEAGAGRVEDAGEPRAASDATLPPPSPLDAAVDAMPGVDAMSDSITRVLVDHRSWQVYDAALDPLKAHQPAQVECEEGWSVDTVSATLDVETTECNYVLLAHPAAVDVGAGATLQLRLWHFDLVAAEPASAHVALLASNDLLWETRIAIPSEAGAIDVELTTPRPIARGEPLRLHLHNHGENSYLVSAIRVETD